MAVVRGDPVLDGLQRRGDPILLLLEQVERDRPGVVSLEQLLLLAFELGARPTPSPPTAKTPKGTSTE